MIKLFSSGRPGKLAMGVVVPSSNRIVERVTEDVLRFIPDVDASYARIPYWGRGNGQPAVGYDVESFLGAVELLTHVSPSTIIWNGTRASAFSFDLDRQLCDDVKRLHGIGASTTSLAVLSVLSQHDVKRLSLVTGGPPKYIDAIAANFAAKGFEIVSQLRMGEFENAEYAKLDLGPMRDFCIEDANATKPDAFLIWSTNLPGHDLVVEVEEATGIPVFDSAAVGVWAGLRELGVDPAPAAARGRLFSGK